ncbi:bacillibactin exporter [Oxobacter pfennigii]|uniref:Bacillibactin exporter n=1 Tax=Oxobacter pfennigii TaxID=36849 RepID=A0A0P8X0I7_9CLOT|nr:MFS transporter [Oxobacter pfennigii]KPU44274.1 bacillibactin exporter [Oxobacter pfennigii]
MNKQKIRAAILAISSVVMITLIASAVLADIAAQFPNIDKSVIQMVLTIPSLVGMVISLMSGPLSSRVSKKSLVLYGLVLALAGGFLALVFGKVNIYILLFSSVLVGISSGINGTLTMSLIADYFTGDERSSLMGLQSAFVNGGSMVILFISAMLAGIQWNYAYLVYIILIPVIFIVAKNLPDDKPVKADKSENNSSDKLSTTVYYICFILFLFSTLLGIFQTNIAMFISDNNLGDASTTGLVNSVMTGAGAFTGVIYGRLKKLLKNYVMAVSIGATALGMLLIYTSGSLPSIFIAGILSGFGLSTMMPTAMFTVSAVTSPAKNATAIAITNAASSIGMFISPLIVNPIVNKLFNGAEEIKFLFAAAGLIIVAAIYIFVNIGMGKKAAQPAME